MRRELGHAQDTAHCPDADPDSEFLIKGLEQSDFGPKCKLDLVLPRRRVYDDIADPPDLFYLQFSRIPSPYSC